MLVIALAGHVWNGAVEAIITEYKIDTTKINDMLKFKVTGSGISTVIEIKEGKETLTSTIDYCNSSGLEYIFKTYLAGKKQSKDTYKTLLCYSHNRFLETLIINEIEKYLPDRGRGHGAARQPVRQGGSACHGRKLAHPAAVIGTICQCAAGLSIGAQQQRQGRNVRGRAH